MRLLERKYTVEDYEKLPEGSPYELIEGELVMSPSPSFEHFKNSKRLFVKLYGLLKKAGKGEVIYAPFDLYLDEEDAYHPDLMVILKGSKAKITSEGVYGSPDVVIEILSPSNAYYDLKIKKNVYEKAGAREYWIIDPIEKSVGIYKNTQEGFKMLCRAEGKGKVFSEVLELELEISEVFSEV
ncbi:Uma2 family endonuclease [Hydrogenobacter thermophilus]|uniref:Uma2 family endonuclease n=1 Tax=Hydrogenobacter thermophilus TaxID=940 RepID=UPI0030F5DAD4